MRGCVQTLGRCEEPGVLGATQHLQASRWWVCSELVVFVSLGLCWPVHLRLSGLLGLPQGPSAPSSQASGLLRPGAWGPLFVEWCSTYAGGLTQHLMGREGDDLGMFVLWAVAPV